METEYWAAFIAAAVVLARVGRPTSEDRKTEALKRIYPPEREPLLFRLFFR
jgi:hypothetical protein